MRIKELAKEINEIRFYRSDAGPELQKLINKVADLIDLIDGAVDVTSLSYVKGQLGTKLFFPDSQPTLKEAVIKLLAKYSQQSDEEFDAHCELIDLKAALEREE